MFWPRLPAQLDAFGAGRYHARGRAPRMNSVLDPETAAQHLGAFPQIARQRLVDVLFDERFDGTIRCEVVEDVRHLGSMTIERFMLAILPVVRLYATPATSAFAVGAVCKGASGNAYFGANLELTGAPLGFTIHAEQSAIANALAHREKAVRHLAVTAPPCGHCRQFLKELTGSSTLEITTATRATMTLASLLPDSFGPGDLGVKEGLLGHAATPLT